MFSVLLASGDSLLDVVEGGGVVTTSGPYASERREGGGVAGVYGDGPLEKLFGGIEIIGRIVEARVGIQGAGVARVLFQCLYQVFLGLFDLAVALMVEPDLQVRVRVFGVEVKDRVIGL